MGGGTKTPDLLCRPVLIHLRHGEELGLVEIARAQANHPLTGAGLYFQAAIGLDAGGQGGLEIQCLGIGGQQLAESNFPRLAGNAETQLGFQLHRNNIVEAAKDTEFDGVIEVFLRCFGTLATQPQAPLTIDIRLHLLAFTTEFKQCRGCRHR